MAVEIQTLVISQTETSGQSRIPDTEREAAIIQPIFPWTAKLLNRTEGTVAAVLEGMKMHGLVHLDHLACHGLQELDSAFSLYDGKLTLSTLMSRSTPSVELAFLSACQTASGDEEPPEEAVHLAVGMLSVGYRGVIGTMWSISDSQA